MVRVDEPQPDPVLPGGVHHVGGAARDPGEDGVEEVVVHNLDATRTQ